MVQVLNLYHFCKEFGQLPKPGGLLDQPAKLMYLFEAVSRATSERAAKDELQRKREADRASNRS